MYCNNGNCPPLHIAIHVPKPTPRPGQSYASYRRSYPGSAKADPECFRDLSEGPGSGKGPGSLGLSDRQKTAPENLLTCAKQSPPPFEFGKCTSKPHFEPENKETTRRPRTN